MNDQNTERDEAMRRLKKLMNFTEENCTPEEFALAAVRIKTILEKYQISMCDVESGTTSESVVVDVVDCGGKNVKGWKHFFAGTLCECFDCKLFLCRKIQSTSFVFVGLKSDVEVASYFYNTCSTLLQSEAKKQACRRGITGHPIRSYVNSFMVGAIYVIGRRLREDRDKNRDTAAESDSRALVVVKDRVIDSYVKSQMNISKRKETHRVSSSDHAGLADGFRMGEEFNISRGIPNSSSVNPQLESS